MCLRSSCEVVMLSLVGAETGLPYGLSRLSNVLSRISGGQLDTMNFVASEAYLRHDTKVPLTLTPPRSQIVVRADSQEK